MSDANRDDKVIKRDQAGARAVQEELLEEIEGKGTKPRVQNPNRDRARGDWDRTGDHHDEVVGEPGAGDREPEV